jgi:N-formylglutamate amidohydrolase
MRWLEQARISGQIWIEQVEGIVPVVITAAHAGTRRIDGIALQGGGTRRSDPNNPPLGGCNRYLTDGDTRTREVAEGVLHHMECRSMRPYMILPLAARNDLDLNRTWEHNRDGYINGGAAQAARNRASSIYRGFYDQIQNFIDVIRGRFGTTEAQRALYIDIHGMGLDPGIDIELGTRSRTSADPGLVYTGAGVSTSLMETLDDEGFNLRSNAATTEQVGGCQLVQEFGLAGGGINAVQIELSQDVRGFNENAPDDRRRIASETGERIARAIEAFLIENNYPVQSDPVTPTGDDETYAALSLTPA